MPRPPEHPPAYQRFFAELKRRKVFRVAAVYGAAAYAVMQVADLVFPRVALPDWSVSLVVWLSLLGFPVVLVMAWVFERTDGAVRVTPAASSEEIAAITAQPVARRWPAGVAALAGILLLAVGAWTAWRVVAPESPDVLESRLAVFPFGVSGTSNLEWLDEGLPTLLSHNLLGPGATETVDPAQVFRKAAPGAGALPLKEAGDYARDLGAGRFVVGTVQAASGRVRIQAALYALRDSIQTLTRGEVEGDTTQLFDLVDRLTAQLLGGSLELGAASRDLVRTAGHTTASLPALRSYLEAERHLRNGDTREASEAFGTAAERDSTFALAMYRNAFAHVVRFRDDIAVDWARRAARHEDRLSVYDRRALDALSAYLDGRVSDAEGQYRELAAEYPSRLDARVLLTILLAQYDPGRGRPMDESVALLKEIREADPGYLCLACLSGQIYFQAENMAALWKDQVAIQDALPDSARSALDRATVAAGYALATGDTAAWREARAGLLATADPDSVSWNNFPWTALISGRPALADTLVRVDFARAGDDDGWAIWFDYIRGRWRDAYGSLPAYRPDNLSDLLTIRAIDTPLDAAAPDALDAARRVLSWTGPIAERRDRPELLPHVRLYGAALLGLQAGRDSLALALADSLAALPTPDDAGPVVRNGIRTIRGEAALRAGDLPGARAQLDSLEWEYPPTALPLAQVFGTRAYMLRGEAAWRDGDIETARRWFDGILANLHGDYSLLQLRRGQIHEEIGDLDRARIHYARVLEALEPADPEVAPRRQEASRRLQALTGEGRLRDAVSGRD